jgi:hypothetical protein
MKRVLWGLLLFMSAFVSGEFARADMLLDFGATYSGDTFNTTTSSNSTQYFYNASLQFALDHRRQWTLGWTVFGISRATSDGAISGNYSSLDMGPQIRWNIDKAGIYSVSAAYGYLAKGAYSSGSTSETWSGSSLWGQFAVQIPIRDDKFYIGLSLNYYSASYSKKVVSSVESSNSAQKSWIFPMLSLTWRP